MLIDSFDLNLLRVFDAVMEERSVLRAGQRIGLSQSAVSHALSRLRHALKDDLFVRTAEGMMPTQRALEIASPVREALSRLESALGLDQFDPGLAHRSFTLAASDYVTAVLVPPLLHRMQQAAPRVGLCVAPTAQLGLVEKMDLGQVDVTISAFSDIPARFSVLDLMRDQEVYVTRAGHPLGAGPLTLEALATHPHAVVALNGTEDGIDDEYLVERGLGRRAYASNRAPLERALAEHGWTRRIGVILPHFLALPMVLAQSDMIAALPRRFASRLAKRYELRIYEAPFAVQPVTVQAIWHSRNDRNRAHMWFRGNLAAVAQIISNE